MKKENLKVKSLVGMIVMTAVVIACVVYYFWQSVSAYLDGGEGAPSLTTLIAGGAVLAVGCGYVISCAVRIYLQEKKRRKDSQQHKEEPEAE